MGLCKHTPRTCMSRNISFLTTWLWRDKLVDLPNFYQESHSMWVTCIFILIILYTTYNIVYIAYLILHIAHIILHITHSYSMRPWNHGHDIKLSKKWGLNIWDLKYGAFFSTHRVCFIHSYILHFISLIGYCKHKLYLGCS